MEHWEQLLLKNQQTETDETVATTEVEPTDSSETEAEPVSEVTEITPAPESISNEEELIEFEEDSSTSEAALDESVIFQTKLKESFGDLVGEDIQEFINSVKEKLSKKEEDALQNIPEDLRKAIELVKDGVDYKEYLKIDNVNYDAFSDADLYGNSVISLFTNQDGTIDQEGLQSHLDSLSDIQLKIEGSKIRNYLKTQQEFTKNKLVNEAKEAKNIKEKNINDAVSSLNSVLNFKVNPYQKEKIKAKLLTSDLSIFTSNGKVDYKTAAEAVFKLENFDKIVNYLKTSTANETKKQILDPLINAEQRTNGTAPLHQEDLNPYLKAQKDLMRQVRGF